MLGGTMALWGGTWISGKILAGDMAPLSASFLRFFTAAIFLYGSVWRQEKRLPTLPLAHLPYAILLGLTGVFLYSWFFFKGLQTVPAGRAALIVACIPVCVAVTSALCFRERFNALKLTGTLLSLAGVAVVLSHGNPVSLLAHGVAPDDMLILGCVAAWTTYSIGGRLAMQHLVPTHAVMWSCVTGAALHLLPALNGGLIHDARHASWVDWGNILFLGVAATGFAYAWYYKGIQQLGASRAAIFINLVPIFAILFATLLLKEPLALSLMGGGAMVITGVIITNRFG